MQEALFGPPGRISPSLSPGQQEGNRMKNKPLLLNALSLGLPWPASSPPSAGLFLLPESRPGFFNGSGRGFGLARGPARGRGLLLCLAAGYMYLS